MLRCACVAAKDGSVKGAVQVRNKLSPTDGSPTAFTEDDTRLVQMMCSHIAVFIQSVE